MIIKKFVGKTEEEATLMARKELGEGVVVMNVRNVKAKGWFSAFRPKQVEITVAMEEETEKFSAFTTAGRKNIKPTEQENRSIGTEAKQINDRLDNLAALLETQMKRQINENKSRIINEEEPEDDTRTTENTEAGEKEEKEEEAMKFEKLLYNTMVDNEVDEKYANQILEEFDKMHKPGMPIENSLAGIYQKMILKFGKADDIQESSEGPKVIAFIGPTGVGKTTTIAKISSLFSVKEKKKCALLTLDTYRIAAAEQLRTYANILMVPFRVIYSVEELENAINDFRDCDYIFIDTTGHSHQNDNQLDDMKFFLQKIQELATCQFFLVLSATTKYRDLKNIVDKYRDIAPYQLIFTKLDETSTIGNLLNIRLYSGVAIAYVTYGQNVPDDIEVFNPQTTVKQLLGGKNTNKGSTE